ncbi:hypothetical protein [Pseudomonas aeruginosa]|uniref:hypothetical protein n=1 Tax=Pseudomonas aeruginosa TaxID=287 RepID=UPI0021F0BD29|nr:hypothetical protein [Pseudomonas aeruginosa]MCV6429384.1 hypothetical protein [Pseudomonas aeruginosa]MCV6437384.1 hypothetical protein [Pseudomonas aeruginosa]
MAESQKVAPQGLQASITAGLGTFATASCMKWIPPEHAQYWVGATTLIVPVISYFIAKFFSAIDEPDGLTQYKARLSKDLAHQKKILDDKHISDDIKAGIREKYTSTVLKLATANQDYTNQGVVVDD